MADLKKLFESLNFKNLRTYIQSGNVVFEDDHPDNVLLSGMIEDKIQKELGLDVSVILRTHEQIKTVLMNNPFLNNGNYDPAFMYVTLLLHQPIENLLAKMSEINYLPDEFRISGNEIYIYCPNGYGKTKLNNSFFETKLKVKATSRNWRTINVLNDMANVIEIQGSFIL